MAIGVLTSGGAYSSLRNTGAPVTDRFTATTQDQELLKFISKDGKDANINTMTIEADGEDLYFSVWIRPKSNKPSNSVDNYDFTDEAVFFCEAGSTVNISGLGIGAIKFENASGARYFLQAMSY